MLTNKGMELTVAGGGGAGVRPPTAQQAHDLLVSALQDQLGWEQRAKAAKELLNQMVKSRRDAVILGQSYDIRCGPQLHPVIPTLQSLNTCCSPHQPNLTRMHVTVSEAVSCGPGCRACGAVPNERCCL